MAIAQKATVLRTWKEVASYLGRGVRTVQRYERDFYLPVRRVSGRKSGSILAFPEDLDQWLKQSSSKDNPPTMQNLRERNVLQVHQQAIVALQSNLRALSGKLEEGQRIRARERWFPPTPAPANRRASGGEQGHQSSSPRLMS
jgi:hypothetical protein